MGNSCEWRKMSKKTLKILEMSRTNVLPFNRSSANIDHSVGTPAGLQR